VDLAGKTKKVRITLTALKEKQLPDLDDEFAQDVGEQYETLDDLKNAIKNRLEKNLEESLHNLKINMLLEKILETTPVDVPESLINLQVDSRLRAFSRQEDIPLEALTAMMKGPESENNIYTERLRAEAIRGIHSRLIIETLIQNENISVSNEEFEVMFKEISEETGQSLEEVKAQHEKENAKTYLEDSIKDKKIFDLLIAENKIAKGEKKSYLEFIDRQNG
jgi:trigger factor